MLLSESNISVGFTMNLARYHNCVAKLSFYITCISLMHNKSISNINIHITSSITFGNFNFKLFLIIENAQNAFMASEFYYNYCYYDFILVVVGVSL